MRGVRAEPIDLEFFLAYSKVEYGIPVDVEAREIKSNLAGSSPANDIVIGEPRTIGLNPNIAFSSFSLYPFLPLKPFPLINSLNSL